MLRILLLAFILPTFTTAPLQAGEGDTGDRRTFSSEKANISLTYSKEWHATPSKQPEILLMLQKSGNMFVLVAAELGASADFLLKGYEDELKAGTQSMKQTILERDTKVAGASGLYAKYELQAKSVQFSSYVLAFTHQGYAYRIVAAEMFGNIEREFLRIRESIRFLQDRSEWTQRFQSKPRRVLLAGGKVSAEIHQPRWRESTLNQERDYRYPELANFDFHKEGAWITIRMRKAKGNGAEEREALIQHLRGFYTRNDCTKMPLETGAGPGFGCELRAQYAGTDRLLRCAALVRNGWAIQLWMESLTVQSEDVRADWDRLLASLHVADADDPEPPAYPLRFEGRLDMPSDPALERVLSGAVRLKTAAADDRANLTVAPDGARAISIDHGGTATLVDLSTGRLTPLSLTPAPDPNAPVGWSADGKEIYYISSAGRIAAYALDATGPAQVFGPPGCTEVTGGTKKDLLYACVSTADKGAADPRFLNVRLIAYDRTKDAQQEILAYPLAKISRVAPSPDGQLLAFAANADLPRTRSNIANLYICKVDGSGLKRLTKGYEHIASIAWAADSSHLYFVRVEFGEEEDFFVYTGLQRMDLWSLPAKGGKPRNLTRSGKIKGVWRGGNDVIFKVQDWGVPRSQLGVFRVEPGVLRKATSALPLPLKTDREVWSKKIAERLKEKLPWERIRTSGPNRETLKQAAEVWAAAIRDIRRVPLDFSLNSLRQLQSLIYDLKYEGREGKLLHFGLSAYYGETLCRAAKAEWQIKEMPFDHWQFSYEMESNPYVETLCPFSESQAAITDDSHLSLRSPNALLKRDPGCKLLLVYPPGIAEEALKEATPEVYRKAISELDRGDTKSALSKLTELMKKTPRSSGLAREVVALCRALGMSEKADQLTREAVESGNEVTDLLIRYAEFMLPRDPRAAAKHCRKALEGDWSPAKAYIILGKAYAAMGKPEFAEACWRQAHSVARGNEIEELRRLIPHHVPAVSEKPAE